MRETTIQKAFNFGLTDARLAEIANEVGTAIGEITELEAKLEAAKVEAKKVPELLKKVKELGMFIKNGAESKLVECRIVYDKPKAGQKTIIRTDTNKKVEVLPMTDEEKQGELFVGPGGITKKEPTPAPPKGRGEKGKLTLPPKEKGKDEPETGK